MKLLSLFCGSVLAISFPNLASAQTKETVPVKPLAPVETGPPAPGKPTPAAAPVKPTEAPAPQGPIPQAKPVEAKPETYVVRSGDNPWAIAKAHNVNLAELMKINNIKDAKNLKVGDTLVLPAGAKSANPAAEKAKETVVVEEKKAPVEEKEGADWTWYTIGKGENPWTVAKKLRVDHQKVMTLNEGLDFRDLKIGQKIKVPKK